MQENGLHKFRTIVSEVSSFVDNPESISEDDIFRTLKLIESNQPYYTTLASIYKGLAIYTH